jgi:hypothetical protein
VNKLTLVLLSCLTAVATVLTLTTVAANAMADGKARQSYWVRPAYDSWNIYNPTSSGDYRTSPSIFKDPTTGLYQEFTCGPDAGTNIPAIYSSTSTDGHTWAPETVVLRRSSTGPDSFGVCDPSVVKVGSFYYLAYSGFDGHEHAVFVARSPSLSQPFVKWTGSGWGLGSAAPIIAFNGFGGFGVGQPSLVFAENQLSIFYEYHDGTTWQTRLSSVNISASNLEIWPTQLHDLGTVLSHPGRDSADACGNTVDSTGVAYDDTRHTYVALTTDGNDFPDSSLQAYESSFPLDFTRSITLPADAGTNPLSDHAHDVAMVTDNQGHITSSTPGSIVYGYGDTDCPSKLVWQNITQGATSTGWVNEPMNTATGMAHWTQAAGSWKFYPQDKAWWGTSDLLHNEARAFLTTAQVGSAATIDLDYAQSAWPLGTWTGLSFGHPTSGGASGYYLRIYTTGTVTLAKGNEDNVVATGVTGGSAPFFTNHLQVVVANGTIVVYNGVGHDSLAGPVLTYRSSDGYLGGYIGLESLGNSFFSNLTIRDNVPDSYRTQTDSILDWKPTTGSWSVRAPGIMTNNLRPGGQIYLQGTSDPTSNYNAHLGDGTYTGDILLDPSGNPQAWGGLNITNGANQINNTWSAGGYVAFIRQNGSLGLYKGGVGQVVPDLPTRLNPVVTPVRLRVVKLGGSIQVYVNDLELPAITYVDPDSTWNVGSFGLATEQTSGTFAHVAYAANGNPLS